MKTAAIGDPTFVAGFRLIGSEAHLAKDIGGVRKVLMDLMKLDEYDLFILPERYVEATSEIRSRIRGEEKVTPLFSFIPDYTGIKGKRVEELKKNVSLAVGTKLKL